MENTINFEWRIGCGLVLLALLVSELPSLAANGERAEIEIERTRYCVAEGGIGWLDLHLQFRLQNIRSIPVFLWLPDGDEPPTEQVVVAQTESDLLHRRYELNTPILSVKRVSVQPVSYYRDQFRILEVKKSYQFKTSIRIPYNRMGSVVSTLGLKPGEHFLMVYLGLWPESPDRAREVQLQLKLPHPIWTGPAQSNILKIEIVSTPSEEKC